MKRRFVKNKLGFTIIEVSLFLAISGLIIAGIVAGTAGSINSHRYDDTVQDFYSFLTGLYSSATNVQNDNGCTDDHTNSCGKSEKAVYGYLAIFGYDADKPVSEQKVYTYNLQGNAEIGAEKPTDLLSAFSMIRIEPDYGSQQTYKVLWEGTLDNEIINQPFKGVVAVVRSPLDGTIYTYYYKGDIALQNINPGRFNRDYFTDGRYANRSEDINFCVNSPDLTGRRRDVRIKADGRNSSAVELVQVDGEDNVCR